MRSNSFDILFFMLLNLTVFPPITAFVRQIYRKIKFLLLSGRKQKEIEVRFRLDNRSLYFFSSKHIVYFEST